MVAYAEIFAASFADGMITGFTCVMSTVKLRVITSLTGLMSARENCVISCAEIATTSCASGMVFALTSIVSTAKRGMVATGASVMSAA